jgi:protein tyrosine/serine phosphatase
VEVFEMIAEPASHPLVFHCTAGKDRTGIVAALLLDAIGVSLHAIGDDYSIMDSQVDWLRAFLGRRAVQRSRVASMDSRLLRCNRETIEEVLLGVNREYGSTRLLLLAAGASPDLFDRLAAALLVARPCPTIELAT